MKIIKELPGAYSSKVELVDVDSVLWVLKTADVDDIVNEKKFFDLISLQGLPVLKTLDVPELKPNQILIEYVPNSPTLSGQLTKPIGRNWGQLMAGIHSIKHKSAARLEKNKLKLITWSDFIQERITKGIEKHVKNKTGLPIRQITQTLSPLLSYSPKEYSLIHGDAHSNNVLIYNKQLYIFDKNSIIFYGDTLFDLALIAIEFPNGLYIKTLDSENQKDSVVIKSFVTGYGTDFINDNRRIFDLYVLMRAFTRFPNKFEPHLEAIIRSVLKSYS